MYIFVGQGRDSPDNEGKFATKTIPTLSPNESVWANTMQGCIFSIQIDLCPSPPPPSPPQPVGDGIKEIIWVQSLVFQLEHKYPPPLIYQGVGGSYFYAHFRLS